MAMNPRTLEAVFEQGVLRPLERLDLTENEHVQVTVTGLSRSTARSVATCYDLAKQAGIIGAYRDSPADLSTNPEHMSGFGES